MTALRRRRTPSRRCGRTVFVDGTIPGETVVCRPADDEGSWATAELLEVLAASPDRVTPVCAFHGRCGGCNLQHMSHSAQVAAKTAVLVDAFARIGGLTAPAPEVSFGEPWGYRNRMQFHAIRDPRPFPGTAGRGPKRATAHLDAFFGLKARNSGDVIPVSDCPVADSGIRALLAAGQKEAAGVLVSPGKDRVTVYSRDGLLLSEAGTMRGKTKVLEKSLAIDASVFFQSNGAMLERLVADLLGIAEALDPAIRALPMADLYCGIGTFAAFLGGLFPRVDLVEENKAALALARENLARHGSTGFHARCAGDWAKGSDLGGYGFAVADPPRQGLEPLLADRLVKRGPAVLAYVSCDPATLARDGGILAAAYDLADLRLYDFYPQTSHIESLAVFVRRR